MTQLKNHFRNTFLAGIFAVIPIAVTAFAIWYAETKTRALFQVTIPFLGVAIAIASIYVLGLAVSSFLGKWTLQLLDRSLAKTPLLREAYSAWKQVVITPGGSAGIFAKVVLVPEGNNRWAIAFTSGDILPNHTACVFVPAAPNPTSGRLYLLPADHLRHLPVSTENAFKMILSGGNFIPDNLLPLP